MSTPADTHVNFTTSSPSPSSKLELKKGSLSDFKVSFYNVHMCNIVMQKTVIDLNSKVREINEAVVKLHVVLETTLFLFRSKTVELFCQLC